MSLYKLMARDDLKQGEVRPYDRPDLDGWALAAEGIPKHLREVRYESLDLNDLGCYLLLAVAHEKAQEMIAEAESEAQRLCAEARHAGQQQGREDAKQEVLSSLVAFGHAGQTLIVFEEQLIERYTPRIVQLALEIAEKIVGRAVQADPQIVTSVLERAKHEVAEARQLRIWLHPADHKILSETSPDLIKVGCDHGRTIEIVPSEDVSRGGCRLETEMGLVDATLPTQMDEIRRQLLDEDSSECGESHARDGKRSQ